MAVGKNIFWKEEKGDIKAIVKNMGKGEGDGNFGKKIDN